MITGKLNPLKEDTTSTKNSQVLVLIIALTTVAISLTTHEIWQDEAEPIAKIHAYGWNLWALMESFRGDVHLPLHYVLLYPFLNIGNLILGIGSAHIIKFFTFLQYALLAFLTIKWVRFPFSALFLSSYYCLFEYGTISRCYLLALILLLTIFRGIVLRQRASVWDILACFLFPLTHLLSVVYSGFLLIYCLLKRNWGRVSALTASYPIALYYFYFRSETAKTYEFQGSLPIGAYVKTFIHSIIAAWLPFSTESIWWNQSFATDAASPALPITILLLSLIVLAIVKLYRFDPLLTIASCLGACSDVAILSIKYPQENFRHVGYAVWPFLGLFVLVLSLPQGKKDKSEPLEIEKPSIFPPLLRYSSIVVLAMHSVFGIAAVYKDVTGIFAFPKAQIQVLEQLTKASPNIALFDYPSGSSLAIVTLSDWKYKVQQIQGLINRNCNSTTSSPGTKAALNCPNEIGITTWAIPLFDLTGQLQNHPYSEKLAGQPVGQFLAERGFSCEQIVAFEGSQTVNEYTYKCVRS